jgi:hypothetical protein
LAVAVGRIFRKLCRARAATEKLSMSKVSGKLEEQCKGSVMQTPSLTTESEATKESTDELGSPSLRKRARSRSRSSNRTTVLIQYVLGCLIRTLGISTYAH